MIARIEGRRNKQGIAFEGFARTLLFLAVVELVVEHLEVDEVKVEAARLEPVWMGMMVRMELMVGVAMRMLSGLESSSQPIQGLPRPAVPHELADYRTIE